MNKSLLLCVAIGGLHFTAWTQPSLPRWLLMYDFSTSFAGKRFTTACPTGACRVFTWRSSPHVGYFVSPNTAIGIHGEYMRTWSNLPNLPIPKTIWGAGAWGRHYFPQFSIKQRKTQRVVFVPFIQASWQWVNFAYTSASHQHWIVTKLPTYPQTILSVGTNLLITNQLRLAINVGGLVDWVHSYDSKFPCAQLSIDYIIRAKQTVVTP